ncbi:unnamed protein product, partial [Phaeothamnion confervicola]
ALFVKPLELVYRNGPRMFGLRQGMSDANVCYELTAVEAMFWTANDNQCADLIERHFNAFLTIIYAATVLVSLYSTYNGFWHYFVVVRPMNKNFERVQRLLDQR